MLSPTPLICVCLQGFGPAVLSSGLSECPGLAGFVLSSLISSPDSFFFLPSANGAKTSGGMMPLRKEPVNACPTCQAKYLSFGVPPPYLLLLLFPPHHHHLPRILENRKYILLSDGWAPCSCWEERKKAFLSLQGSQMSLAVSKLRVGSAFSGASWNARSPSAWKLQALLHYVCGEN